MLTPFVILSLTANGLTLYAGESIAACRAHPLATHSSAFKVVDSSFSLKHFDIKFLNQGTRDAPPTISTYVKSSLSKSSIRHSTPIGAWSFADSTFLHFWPH